jgi:hypothetical protein
MTSTNRWCRLTVPAPPARPPARPPGQTPRPGAACAARVGWPLIRAGHHPDAAKPCGRELPAYSPADEVVLAFISAILGAGAISRLQNARGMGADRIPQPSSAGPETEQRIPDD